MWGEIREIAEWLIEKYVCVFNHFLYTSVPIHILAESLDFCFTTLSCTFHYSWHFITFSHSYGNLWRNMLQSEDCEGHRVLHAILMFFFFFQTWDYVATWLPRWYRSSVLEHDHCWSSLTSNKPPTSWSNSLQVVKLVFWNIWRDFEWQSCMIFEGLCDFEDWNNGCWKFSFAITRTNFILKYNKIENSHFNCNNI